MSKVISGVGIPKPGMFAGSNGTPLYIDLASRKLYCLCENQVHEISGGGSEGPQGPQGEPGEQGSQGIQGVKGDTGAAGSPGIQGVKGDKGDTGDQGIQGIPGNNGSNGSQGIQGIQGVPGPNNLLNARVTQNRTTTATAMASITDLALPIGVSETVSFEAYLVAGCNNTGGSQFSVTVPVGATLKARISGNTNAATTWTSSVITTSDAVSATLLNISAQGREVVINGIVVNGANAGSIQGRFKSVTNGQTTTVEANSYMTGRRH